MGHIGVVLLDHPEERVDIDFTLEIQIGNMELKCLILLLVVGREQKGHALGTVLERSVGCLDGREDTRVPEIVDPPEGTRFKTGLGRSAGIPGRTPATGGRFECQTVLG